MRKLCCFFLIVLSALTATAQTTATLDSAMSLFRQGKKAEALPLFKRIYAGSDAALQQKATITVSEYWATHKESIVKDQTSAEFGNMLIAHIRSVAGKQSPGTADIYTIGIGYWGVISTGTLRSESRMPVMETSLSALDEAARQGYPNASYFMVQELRYYKLFQPGVPYQEIIGWTNKAMLDTKSVAPVLELMVDLGDTWYKKELADTSRMMMAYAFNMVLEKMPDSLYLLADRAWKNTRRSFADDQPVEYLNVIFSKLNTPELLPRISKAYAWHLLYKYFYSFKGSRQYSQKDRDARREKIMDTIKTVYGADQNRIMMLMADFIANTGPDGLYEYANLQEPDWMDKAKAPFTGTTAFYRAAILSGKFYAPLLASDPNAAKFTQAIVDAYTERLRWIDQFNKEDFKTPEGYAKTELEKLFLFEARVDRANLAELIKIPAFANNQAIKFHDVNANLNYLETFMVTNNLALTQEADDIMKKLSSITPAEKQAFDLTYIKHLESDLSVFRALAQVTSKGVDVDIPEVDIRTGKITHNTVKIYGKDEGGKKKDEVLAQLRAFLGK